jgi:site-specific DNA recombinase
MSTDSPDKIPTLTKRAFDYLRVSSDGQVRTDYDPDGLSINAQREADEDKARQLDAEIVREFLDPGKSAYVDLHKRTDFLEMLEELKRCNADPATFIDYVIVWSLSRFARNQRDYWMSRELVRQAGARLVSVSEPMIGDDSAAAFFTESIIAAKNQYESMQTSENVKRSLYQKAKNGGTYGWTRLGYANSIDQLPDGRRVAIVTPDPDRHHYITAAFKLYASGEYPISQLADELYRLGLRSRPRKNRPPQKVNAASIHRVLRDPYFAGWIAYKRGKPDEEVFKGRHEPLIDQETFDRVQMLLDEKRVAGERPQKRQHYLRGSIFCHKCGNRLTYGVSTGENGRKYAYYFCSSRINRTSCTERANYRPELIEAAILPEYAKVELAYSDLERRKAAIRAMSEVAQESLALVREAKTELIAKLKAQQQRLIRLHTEEGDDTSPDAFRAERARMKAEIIEAEKSLAETNQRLKLEHEDLCAALELAGDVQAVYTAAHEITKRGYNQAFFRRIKIRARWDHKQGRTVVEVAGVELTEPYAALLAEQTTEEALAWVEAIKASRKPQNAEKRPQGSSGRLPGALSNGDISIFVKLAEGERFELSVRQSGAQRFSRPPHSTALPPLQGDAPKAR